LIRFKRAAINVQDDRDKKVLTIFQFI